MTDGHQAEMQMAAAEAAYGQESDDQEEGIEAQDEGEEGDDGENQIQIHPDLIAAAHEMGIEMNSEQIHEL